VWVSELVAVAVVGAADDAWPPLLPDEQPAIARAVTAAVTQRGYLRMLPIYATLASVIEMTGIRGCCTA
jgi:hypothetical protein